MPSKSQSYLPEKKDVDLLSKYRGCTDLCPCCERECIVLSRIDGAYDVPVKEQLLFHQLCCDIFKSHADRLLWNMVADYVKSAGERGQGVSRSQHIETPFFRSSRSVVEQIWNQLETDTYIYRTYDDDHFKWSFHHWNEGNSRKPILPPCCPQCNAWVDEDNQGDPRDHRNFHLAWCKPYPGVGKHIAKTYPTHYYKKEAEVIDAVCDVIRHFVKQSLIDDGVDSSTIFKSLVSSKKDKDKMQPKPLTVVSYDKNELTNTNDSKRSSNLFVSHVKQEIQEFAEQEYSTFNKRYLDANKFDIMNALDVLEELSYLHCYMVNGVNYYFMPKQPYW